MMASNPLSSEGCCKIDFQQLFAKADELFTGTFPSMPLSEDGFIKNSDEALKVQIASPTILLHVKSEGIFDAEKTTCFIRHFLRDIVRQPTYSLFRMSNGLIRSSQSPLIEYLTSDHFTISSSMRLCSPILDASKLPPQTVANFRQLRYPDRGFISLVWPESSHLHDRNFLPWESREQAIFRALKEYEKPHNRAGDGIWGRVVPEWIDFTIPKGWLDFCKCNHARNCGRPTSAKQLQGFRLINCHRDPVVVESCTLEANYVALSYVWKSSPETSDGWPGVVLHAIEVTRQLGYQYLWVDRYCINQTNEREKAHQVTNMHSIFQRAELTLVAATNDVDGLSGVRRSGSSSQFARRAQKKLQIGDMTLVTVLDPKKAVAASNWSQRGWTFQEGLLSRRVLVFTDSQLYWNCCGMSERECLYIPAEISHLSDMSQQGRWMTAGIFDRASKGSLRASPETDAQTPDNLTISLRPYECTTCRIYAEIWDDIKDYSARYLTYDGDSLNGFKGVMQMHMVRAGSNIKFILGLPVSIIPGLDLNSAFAYALSTWASTPVRSQYRRYHLPSWSWTGWGKQVYWKVKYWIYSLHKALHRRVYSNVGHLLQAHPTCGPPFNITPPLPFNV
ncbi:heterokaryon incompatibility protein-domain-containing protein [Xylaria arbuscula]|nr:heterokaryon incompatibility protein-domain-containing protein [Xylaria arbuscula]